MPPPVPEKFTSEVERMLWRDIARLQEDYPGDHASFLRVVDDIMTKVINSDIPAATDFLVTQVVRQERSWLADNRKDITYEERKN